MAHNSFKEKSPIRSYSHKQAHGLDNGNTRIAESISCGCSLKNFHGNLSNLAKPTKYKISQIWPLFRHEYTVANKLDRGNRPSLSTSARKGFVRSPSPQQQRKCPVFSGVSMQRDNYVEMSATKPPENEDEKYRHQSSMSLGTDYDDSIPMGTVLCTSKGSPCYNDHLQYGAEAGKEDPHGLERKDSVFDEVRSRISGRKRLGSSSPRQSDDLYAAVEREFKRLGIYNERKIGVQYDHKGKMSQTSSPESLNKHIKDDLKESDCPYQIDCSEYTVEIDHRSLSPRHHHNAHGHYRDLDQGDIATSLSDHHTIFHKYHGNQHSSMTGDHGNCDIDGRLSYSSNISQHEEYNTHALDCIASAAATRISPYNVVESFVSLSDVLCKMHFASLIRKAEASIQRFTSYLIKAKQRAMFRENPSHTPHKHEITASMISSLMSKVRFQSPHHFKYGLQACISKVIFDHFDTQSYGGEVDLSYKINRQFMFLRAYYVLEALENCNGEQLMEINEDFQQFCHAKLEAMKRKVGWVSRWPSKLLQAFLLALKDVWVAHKLAFAFEKPASVFFATPKSALDLEHMSPLLESSTKQSLAGSWARTSPRLSPYSNTSPSPKLDRLDDGLGNISPKTDPHFEMDMANSQLEMKDAGHGIRELITKHENLSPRWNGIVQFSVFPGFLVIGEGVLHCIVYLQPKADYQHYQYHHPNPTL
ncbi:hypothetical protein GOP47_0013800 [Adiantum capillus-veneris]|uniref:Uncharacterized protein n=1 Tax=Adiantum capillus-veneris TaxID=13818 RepID=A0A9D4UPQ7_ADICA|nr:hypothetical protein GOP47_0013800 [Adiantum capillus-veneris]